jgi:small subunit ribosomal protein S20
VANHASALKRHRQSEKRRRRNQAIKTRLRHLVRAVREALGARDANNAASRLLDATRALDKAATKGVVHRRNASRRIARLTQAVGQLKTGS